MKDLFVLQDDEEGASTETSNIFSQLSEDINAIQPLKDNSDKEKALVPLLTPFDDAEVSGLGNSLALVAKGKDKAFKIDGEVDAETNVLSLLFDAQGIHSAVTHDMIMNAHEEERVRLEEQASQVAQRAAEALRQSRMLRGRDSISIPTWTGRSGAAGGPSSVRKKFGSTVNSQLVSNSKASAEVSSDIAISRSNGFSAGMSTGKALSSTELLARIRGTQERADVDGLEQQFGLISSGSNKRTEATPNAGASSSRAFHKISSAQPEVSIRQICSFIQQKGGSTSSAAIVQYFKDRIPPKDLPLFKNLLKEIATLEKDENGSSWILKPENQQ